VQQGLLGERDGQGVGEEQVVQQVQLAQQVLGAQGELEEGQGGAAEARDYDGLQAQQALPEDGADLAVDELTGWLLSSQVFQRNLDLRPASRRL
jgi:hypothetical protein